VDLHFSQGLIKAITCKGMAKLRVRVRVMAKLRFEQKTGPKHEIKLDLTLNLIPIIYTGQPTRDDFYLGHHRMQVVKGHFDDATVASKADNPPKMSHLAL
jgi:hypothetical protein